MLRLLCISGMAYGDRGLGHTWVMAPRSDVLEKPFLHDQDPKRAFNRLDLGRKSTYVLVEGEATRIHQAYRRRDDGLM
jgi:hypothetical protein